MRELGLRRLVGNTVANFSRQLIVSIVQLVTLAIIAQVYGPRGAGLYTVSLLLPSLMVNLLSFGIGPANVYHIASGKVSAAVAWRVSCQMGIYLGALGLAGGGLFIALLGDKWFPGVPTRMLWLALVSFPLSLGSTLVSSIFQGLQNFRIFNTILITQPISLLVGVISISLLDGGISDVILAHNVSNLSSLTVSLIFVYRLRSYNSYYNDCYLKKAINYAYKAHLSNIVTFLNYKIDIVLVNFFMGAAPAGLYALAVQLSERLWMPSQALSTTLLPRLAELSEDEEKRLKLTPLMARATLWLTSFGAIILAAVALPLTVLIFGREFAPSYVPLLVLLPGVVAGSASRVLANDIAARGRPEYNMYSAVFVLGVNVAANVLLIPPYGLFGAALATTIAYTLNFVLRLAMHQLLTGILWHHNVRPTREDFNLVRNIIRKFGGNS